ncbi:MAG TPA: LytTR family DNA-binding domain-containing protein [Gemmatimonadaceae bacterium]|jgi:two-component system LytT family response regulator
MESRQASEAIRVLVAVRHAAKGEALASQLATFSDVTVVGRFRDGARALGGVRRLSPDLLFVDRSMLAPRDMREVRRLLDAGSPLVAFVMTQPQPIAAFEPNAIDYLPLPSTRQRTRTTIDRAKERLDVSSAIQSTFLQRIPARTRDGFQIIPVEELVSAVAHREYLHLTTRDGDRHVMLYALKELQAKLNPTSFIRLSRNTLVNVAFVRHVVPGRGGLLTVALSNGDEHDVSRRRARDLRELLLRL